MTRKSRREIERDLEDLADTELSGPAIAVVGEGDTEFPTAEEFEERHGHPPGDGDGIVIHYPEAAARY